MSELVRTIARHPLEALAFFVEDGPWWAPWVVGVPFGMAVELALGSLL